MPQKRVSSGVREVEEMVRLRAEIDALREHVRESAAVLASGLQEVARLTFERDNLRLSSAKFLEAILEHAGLPACTNTFAKHDREMLATCEPHPGKFYCDECAGPGDHDSDVPWADAFRALACDLLLGLETES